MYFFYLIRLCQLDHITQSFQPNLTMSYKQKPKKNKARGVLVTSPLWIFPMKLKHLLFKDWHLLSVPKWFLLLSLFIVNELQLHNRSHHCTVRPFCCRPPPCPCCVRTEGQCYFGSSDLKKKKRKSTTPQQQWCRLRLSSAIWIWSDNAESEIRMESDSAVVSTIPLQPWSRPSLKCASLKKPQYQI